MALSWLACACMWGCAPEAPRELLELRVALSACEPRGDVQLTLVAEGHYPAREGLFFPWRATDAPLTPPPFPGETRAYRIEARGGEFEGAGRVTAAPGGPHDVLVLPFGRACVAARLEDGELGAGAAAAFGDSQLLWLGAAAEAGSLRITPAAGEVAPVAEPLFVPRSGASVTPSEEGVVVVGGRQLDAPDAPALASYERFSPALDGFDEVGRLSVARSDHAAVRSVGGEVWVAGGRDEGRLLDSVERVGQGEADVRLAGPSDQLALRALDDGSVVALDFARSAVPSVQHFDPSATARLDAADLPVRTTPPLVVALPGQRLLAFEVDDGGETSGRACLRFGHEGDECLEGWLTSFAGLSRARAVALRDGRALVTGARQGQATLRLVDVGRRVVQAGSLPFVPQWTGLLNDGSVALVGTDRVALLREDVLSPTLELPATLLAPDATLLALDSVTHWRWEGLTLVAAQARARVHLAAVRLQDSLVQVRTEGPLDVQFGFAGGDTRTVRIEADEIDLFGTTLTREGAGPVRIERRGERWTVEAGGARASRVVRGLRAPARLSLRAPDAGTRIEELTIERL